jgi:hypothetical protein
MSGLADQLMAVREGAYAAAEVRRLVAEAAAGLPADKIQPIVAVALGTVTDYATGKLTRDEARLLFEGIPSLIEAVR